MGRAIEPQNSFLQVLLKLIPSEVIAVFVFVQGVLPGELWPHVVVAVVLVAITPLYLSYAAGVKSPVHLALSTVSMAVWIYAMGAGPLRFARPPYYEPWHGAVVLAVWTLVPPMLLTQRPAADLSPASGRARQPRAPAKKTPARKATPRRRAPRNPAD
jgi:hypothetical protein